MKPGLILVSLAAAVCAPGQTADALKADVSFLASDALEGRGTPSPGLTVASEFVAAGFRRAGLEPAGDDGYFQTASYVEATPSLEGFELTLDAAGKTIHVPKSALAVPQAAAVDLTRAAVWKAHPGDLPQLSPEQVDGKVLVISAGAPATGRGRLTLPPRLHPALVIRLAAGGDAGFVPRLREAGAPVQAPVVTVWDRDFRQALAAMKPGPLDAAVTARIPPPAETPVKLRNVVGLLRGSDPALAGTYLVVSAHYDHLGVRGTGPGDHIFHGANDDASGTASVMEIALALKPALEGAPEGARQSGPEGTREGAPARPKRSIVFIAFFGEERGELGSHYYVRHPIFPLAQTVADVNLEQLGRTDETGGPRVGMFNLTGFDFTNLPEVFRRAAAQTGIRLAKDEANSDRYFTASDNAAFAEAGVPATTVSVTYSFPDYHGVGDEWPKLDYDNMAQVDRAIALAVRALADSAAAPEWNASNPATEPFVKARGKH